MQIYRMAGVLLILLGFAHQEQVTATKRKKRSSAFGIQLNGVRNCAVLIKSCPQKCTIYPQAHVYFELNSNSEQDISCMLVNDTRHIKENEITLLSSSSTIADFFTPCCQEVKEEEKRTGEKVEEEESMLGLILATLTCSVATLILFIIIVIYRLRNKGKTVKFIATTGHTPMGNEGNVLQRKQQTCSKSVQCSPRDESVQLSPNTTNETTEQYNTTNSVSTKPLIGVTSITNSIYDRVTFMGQPTEESQPPPTIMIRNNHADNRQLYTMAEQVSVSTPASPSTQEPTEDDLETAYLHSLSTDNLCADYIKMPMLKSKRTQVQPPPLAHYDILKTESEVGESVEEIYNVLDRQKASISTDELLTRQVFASRPSVKRTES